MKMEKMLRLGIVETALALNHLGLNPGRSGNVSARCEDTLLVTPSGVACEAMTPKMIARMAIEGDETWSGPLQPSSEWRFHRDIYRARADAGAIVHTHATYCTVFSMLREDIPAAHYMIASFGGPSIRCTAYAPYGTQELAELAIAGLQERHGVLLGSHGMITLGRDLAEALARAVELETLAKQVYLARAIGRPVILPDDEIMRTVERFKTYGRNAQDEEVSETDRRRSSPTSAKHRRSDPA